jgi:hypothetical protein
MAPNTIDPGLAAVLTLLEHNPSRETLKAVVLQLARCPVDQAPDVLRWAVDRTMRALASRATIRLETARERDVFLSLPPAIRSGFEIWFGRDLPRWDADCPRCDGPLDHAHDSYGMSTYTYLYRCQGCGWRGEQSSDEPTMASIYEEMNRRQADEELRRAIASASRDRSSPDCWPWPGVLFDIRQPWPSPIDRLRGLAIHDFLMSRGVIDHVTLSADQFLARGKELYTLAPIRSVGLLDAGDRLVEILSSPLVWQLTGLTFACHDRDALIDALITATPLPHLRHLRIEGVAFDRTMLEALAHAPIIDVVSCFHAEDAGLLSYDDSDYISFCSWTANGRAIREFARRRRRPWLDAFLAPLRSHLSDRSSA